VEIVGREAALERGARAGSVTREWTSGGSIVLFFGASLVGGAAEREKGEERGVRSWGRHAARGAWGLAPTGGRHPDCVSADCDPAVARAGGTSLFGQRHAGADARALAIDGRGSEKRESRRAWAGPRRKRGGRAQMNGTVLDLFKLIQTSSN
jgi:hypothetical protein